MNKAPTSKQVLAFWATVPEGEYTCADCGRTDSKAYIQPQHPFFAEGRTDVARCADCISRRNDAARARRKVQLDSMPRCEIPMCKRRGLWKVGPQQVLLCGAHFKRAKRGYGKVQSGNPFALFMPGPMDRDSILDYAKG